MVKTCTLKCTDILQVPYSCSHTNLRSLASSLSEFLHVITNWITICNFCRFLISFFAHSIGSYHVSTSDSLNLLQFKNMADIYKWLEWLCKYQVQLPSSLFHSITSFPSSLCHSFIFILPEVCFGLQWFWYGLCTGHVLAVKIWTLKYRCFFEMSCYYFLFSSTLEE